MWSVDLSNYIKKIDYNIFFLHVADSLGNQEIEKNGRL